MSGSLTHSPAKILQQLLIDLGVVASVASGNSWPCFHSLEPDSPDQCVTTYDTEGRTGGRVAFGETLEVHGVQIRIRALDVETGNSKINDIVTAMDDDVNRNLVTVSGVGPVVVSKTYRVHAISRSGSISRFGLESPTSERTIWTVNFIMSVTAVS